MRPLTRSLFILIFTMAFCHIAWAEEGILVVQVSDPLGKPLAGVVLSATGDSSTSAPTEVIKQVTEVSGKARIKLADSTRPGDEVELVMVKAQQDLVFISPWNQRVTVPCFENNTRCVVRVVLAERGSRMLLEYPPAQLALVAKVNVANATTTIKGRSVEEQRPANLAEVAKAYGYTPEDVDRAIRSLGKATTDPYELGQVALYESNYLEAERQLSRSKAERKDALADVSFSLGQTYYEQGRYEESVKEYQEAAALRPDDGSILNGLGNALHQAGQYMKAEEIYQRSLKIREKLLGSEHRHVATGLNNLALLYTDQGRYVEAEPLYKRALAIYEKRLGPEHLLVAFSLNNLANLYQEQGKYAEAEPLYKRSLAIFEKQLGPDHPNVSSNLNNLAHLYQKQGNFAGAEQLYKRALAITEKRLGLEHPLVATTLNNLANLYKYQGKYAEAEPLYKRALVIIEQKFGLEHPLVATVLENYADLLRTVKRNVEAEKMEARAKAIQAKGSNTKNR
jgi:tetratricopeptide (TPR) repeat protein